MDGNGRWGKKRGKSRKFGHANGVKTIEKIVKYSIKLKIPILTFYTFVGSIAKIKVFCTNI